MSATYRGQWRWQFLERFWLRRVVILLTAVPGALVCAMYDVWTGQPEFWARVADSWRRHDDDR
jgi:hypothetical protein